MPSLYKMTKKTNTEGFYPTYPMYNEGWNDSRKAILKDMDNWFTQNSRKHKMYVPKYEWMAIDYTIRSMKVIIKKGIK